VRYRRADDVRVHLVLVVAVAIVFTGCAQTTATTHLRAGGPAPTHLPRAARAQFSPEQYETIYKAAVRALRARGWEIATCDPIVGVVTTAPVEVDMPCGESTCLAREYTSVKLGYRRVRVTVTREVWNTTVHEWREPEDRVSVESMVGAERQLLDEAIRSPAGKVVSRLDQACAAPECEPLPTACLAANEPGGI
jgi:hypothetical protein